MKLKFLFLLLFSALFANSGVCQYSSTYTGKRIHISSGEIVSESKRTVKIRVVLANTGREDVRLHEGLNRKHVVFTFDDNFKSEKLNIYKDLVINQLLALNTTLHAGQLFTPKALKIKKAWLNEKVESHVPIVLDAPEKHSETKPVIVELEPVRTKAPTNTSPNPQKEILPETTEPEVAESIKKEPEILSPIGELPKPETTKTSNKSKVLSPIGEVPKPEVAMQCFDLLVDSLVIEKSTRRYMVVSFDLINYGQGIFSFNRKNPKLENLSIKTFFASIPRLTRGSLITGGEHFDKIFKEKEFTLGFGESIRGKIKIPLEKMTKFTPVVILEVDPFSAINECDKVNNVSTIVWKGN